jgi:hypothetical protein
LLQNFKFCNEITEKTEFNELQNQWSLEWVTYFLEYSKPMNRPHTHTHTHFI